MDCLEFKNFHACSPILQVKLRPTEANLWDIHSAAARIEDIVSPEPLDGSQAALALHSLASVLLQDGTSSPDFQKSIVLITDRLFHAEDFTTYLTVSAKSYNSKSLYSQIQFCKFIESKYQTRMFLKRVDSVMKIFDEVDDKYLLQNMRKSLCEMEFNLLNN